MKHGKIIGRRNFLKLTGTSLIALPYNLISTLDPLKNKPEISLDDIPKVLKGIFQRIPKMVIRPDGYLWYWENELQKYQQTQIAQTQWNIERNNSFERLFPDKSWGIVLHWFGAAFLGEQSLASYLRGFDGLRQVGSYQTRTSAHFLVGDSATSISQPELGVIQTQFPDSDGTPLVASHLYGLDYQAHENRQQYFVRAFYELGYNNKAVRSILTDLYDGPHLDPNYRTIAVEMTGANFYQYGNEPSEQQIANVVALLYALMLRYKIPVLNVLGHHEIELRKSDPGKKFMALIRYLLGIYALYIRDEEFFGLVFGEFISMSKSPWQGIIQYFEFIRDYQVVVDFPDQVYQWEAIVNYWEFYTKLARNYLPYKGFIKPFNQFSSPIKENVLIKKNNFLSPPDHEGVDLYLAENDDVYNPHNKIKIFLPAEGECLTIGYGAGCGFGYSVLFRHIEKNGTEVISIFSNLDEIKTLKVGAIYPAGYLLGTISAGSALGEGYLHFAIAYGATWEMVLKNNLAHPSDVTPEWVKQRYIDPLYYLMCWQVVNYPDQLTE